MSSNTRVSWQSISGLATDQSGTFTATTDGTITANYQTEYLLAFEVFQLPYTVNPCGDHCGTVLPPSGWYPKDSTITLQAIPAPGFDFVSWGNTCCSNPAYYGTSNPVVITITGPSITTVNFQPHPDFSLSVNPNPLNIVAGGSGAVTVAVSATAIDPYAITLTTTSTPYIKSNFISSQGQKLPNGRQVPLDLTIDPSTPPDTYSVTITGTSGTLSHSITLTLNISGGSTPTPTPTPNPHPLRHLHPHKTRPIQLFLLAFDQ